MRINIIYKDDKITIDSTKRTIDLIELFDKLRNLYEIENDKKLILLSESITYKENEFTNNKQINEANLSKNNLKEEFVLMCLDDYENVAYKSQVDPNDTKYTKENLIMSVTGASEPIKLEKRIRPKGRLLRTNILNNFDMNNLIEYQRLGGSDLADDDRSEESLLGNIDIEIANRYNALPSLLGRMRERDSDQRVEYSFYTTSSSVREEDINRLVNEMGFPDNSVRIALRMTRNNINRAVDLLLNNPEELTEENIELSRPQQSILQRSHAAIQTNASSLNREIPSIVNREIGRNYDERSNYTILQLAIYFCRFSRELF